MWFIRDIVLVVGCLVMALLSIAGIIGIVLDIQEINNNIPKVGLTWFELGVIIFAVAFWLVVIKFIIRLNKFERAKPLLNTSLLSFPMSGYRISLENNPFALQKGYGKIVVRNTGGLTPPTPRKGRHDANIRILLSQV